MDKLTKLISRNQELMSKLIYYDCTRNCNLWYHIINKLLDAINKGCFEMVKSRTVFVGKILTRGTSKWWRRYRGAAAGFESTPSTVEWRQQFFNHIQIPFYQVTYILCLRNLELYI